MLRKLILGLVFLFPAICYAELESPTNLQGVCVQQLGGEIQVNCRTRMNNVFISSAAISSATISNINTSSLSVTNLTVSNLSINSNSGYVLLYSSTVFDTTGSSSTTGTTYAPSKTSVTITPKTSTSRIEISWSGVLETSNGSSADALATINRGSTNLAGGTNALCVTSISAANRITASCGGSIMDSPATTSATTYTVYFRTDVAGVSVVWGSAVGLGGTTIIVPSITVKEWSY